MRFIRHFFKSLSLKNFTNTQDISNDLTIKFTPLIFNPQVAFLFMKQVQTKTIK